MQNKMSLDSSSMALNSFNGRQNWGRIDKIGRMAMLFVQGRTDKVFSDNISYIISDNIARDFMPLSTQVFTVPRGNWENGTTNMLELVFSNNQLKVSPLYGDIPAGGYICFTITYITQI